MTRRKLPVVLGLTALVCGAADLPARAQSTEASCGAGLLPASSEVTDTAFGTVRAVVVDGDVGTIRVTASAAPATTVRTLACYTAGKPVLSQVLTEGVLRITSRCPRVALIALGVGRCSRDVAVSTPAPTEVTALTGVGDVEAAGIAGATRLTTGVGGAPRAGRQRRAHRRVQHDRRRGHPVRHAAARVQCRHERRRR